MASAGKRKQTKRRFPRPSHSWIYRPQSPMRLNLMSSTQATINASSTRERTTRASLKFSSCLKGKTAFVFRTPTATFPTTRWSPGAAVPRLDTISAMTVTVLPIPVMERPVLGPGTVPKWEGRELSALSTYSPTVTWTTQPSPFSTVTTAGTHRTLSKAFQLVRQHS